MNKNDPSGCTVDEQQFQQQQEQEEYEQWLADPEQQAEYRAWSALHTGEMK